jgi:hypothetical protein
MYAQDLPTVSGATATVTSGAALANYQVEIQTGSTCPLPRLNRSYMLVAMKKERLGGRLEENEGDLS